jgi:hypothetical protein
VCFHHVAKGVKGKHIEEQVHVVLVDQSGSDEPEVFMVPLDGVRVQHPLLLHGIVAPGVQTGNDGDDDND